MLLVTAGLILLSSLDDAFIDLYFIIHKIRRRFFIYRRFRPYHTPDLLTKDEQHFAIMVPAWQEAAVIQAMLEQTLTRYHYKNYHIFVGCYPNDPDTQNKVMTLAHQDNRIHLTRLPHPGPTCKADCLNHIYQDIRHFEQQATIAFAGYILHDAEDLVHPMELKLYNHLIPRKDMIQIPVIPLVDHKNRYNLTCGHYQDEFAENHVKEMVVREHLSGHVPSAGVGTALSRRAMATITNNHQAPPFTMGNLTEDYDLALRLKAAGLKLIFTRFWASPGDLIATREYFPDKTSTAIRQKSRWLMGIALQGWRHQKWPGGWAMKYALFRDRKAILTAQLTAAAYFILFNMLLVYGLESLFPDGYRYPPLVRADEPLAFILQLNFYFLVHRVMLRMYFTDLVYGPRIALLSLPRQIWGNILNFLATSRALYLYSCHLMTGMALVWDKTDHTFPDSVTLPDSK